MSRNKELIKFAHDLTRPLMVITDGGKEDFGIDTTYVKVPRTKFLGVTMTFIVTEGKLLLGGSQGIFFEEFDGPRKRNYFVKVVEG